MTTNKSDVHGRYFITPPQILERFLLTGSLGPVYKANDKFADFSAEIRETIKAIFTAYPKPAFQVLYDVAFQKKAAKKPPLLLALAAAMTVDEIKTQAEVLAKVELSTATDQFVLAKMILDYGRGKGRSFKRQVNLLYRKLDKKELRNKLALQMVKYRNRAGWTHRDLLRVGHYKPSEENNDLFKWVVGKGPASHPILEGYEAASQVTTPAEAVALIQGNSSLPWEAFPTEVMANREVWENLLPNLGYSAVVRNLGRMSALGVDLRPHLEKIEAACAMNHPVSALSAWKVYGQGHGERGTLKWKASPEVIQALESGFYKSFGSLQKSDAKVVFGLDVSGSMQITASTVAGLTCREVAAAMMMVAMKQQPYMVFGFSHSLIPLVFEDHWRLDDVMRYLTGIPYGDTNASLPIKHCIVEGIQDVDLFAIYTDNDTNCREKPASVLSTYRAQFNPNATLATVALQGGAFSIADPNDPGQMDFVGFDPSVPGMLVSLAEQKLV